MIKILVVDDQLIFRDGLANLLSEDDLIVVVGKATNGLEALEFLNQHPDTDIILTDYRMPELDGIALTKKILQNNRSAKVIILTMYDDEERMFDSLLAGAKGFLSKDSEPKELFDGIHDVYAGKYYLEAHNFKILINKLAKNLYPLGISFETVKPVNKIFTERELEILQLICEEQTTQEIADKLLISKRTIEVHRNNMMNKVGVKNLVGLIMFAINNGLIKRKEDLKAR